MFNTLYPEFKVLIIMFKYQLIFFNTSVDEVIISDYGYIIFGHIIFGHIICFR